MMTSKTDTTTTKGSGRHTVRSAHLVLACCVLGSALAIPARSVIAADPRPVLHLRAWSEAPLKDLAGPHKTAALLGERLGSDPADPTRTRLLDRVAWGFDPARGSRIFLGQGESDELRTTGPLTVAAVIQLDAYPSDKAAIISKWQLIDGGRAYELGIDVDRYVYFHVSASGKWDARAAEVIADRPVKTGVAYLVAGVFEPGQRLAVFINGVQANEYPPPRVVPKAVYNTVTPVLVGTRPGGKASGMTGSIGELWIFDRALTSRQLERLTRDAEVTSEVEPPLAIPQPPHDLGAIRAEVRKWYRRLQAPEQPYGAYRMNPRVTPDLYASADLAWIRWMMDDLNALTDAQRREWIGFIRDQQKPDGTYRHRTGHIAAHAFCHATGALNMLGGAQKYRPAFLDRYRDVGGVDAWLAGIDWRRPWGASHDIWGAGVPLACTTDTPKAWRDAVFAWLDHEVNPQTGMWRRGIRYDDAVQPLGGAFHIWPIYAAMGRPLPYPERIIDRLLAVQRPDGSFEGGFGYGNMDGVWVLAYLMPRHAHRRAEVRAALERNLAGLIRAYTLRRRRWLSDAHITESRIATLAILSAALPDRFRGGRWRDPWHQRELFEIKVDGQGAAER